MIKTTPCMTHFKIWWQQFCVFRFFRRRVTLLRYLARSTLTGTVFVRRLHSSVPQKLRRRPTNFHAVFRRNFSNRSKLQLLGSPCLNCSDTLVHSVLCAPCKSPSLHFMNVLYLKNKNVHLVCHEYYLYQKTPSDGKIRTLFRRTKMESKTQIFPHSHTHFSLIRNFFFVVLLFLKATDVHSPRQ